ncbi:MAG: efflux RND transporter periplasmic adaptor subunit [Phycisphaerales bacterium]|nr:efflux RND transporter periplasmic adaptor subunit [Phycisphaerales bacterium]
MIDLSNLKAPGWHRVVADLSGAAPDDRSFMARLVTVLAQVSGARQGVLFTIPEAQSAPDDPSPAAPPLEAEARAIFVWPLPAAIAASLQRAGQVSERIVLDTPIDESTIDFLADAKSAARSAHGSRQTRVFGLDKTDDLYDGSPGKGYVVAVPIFGAAGAEAAAAPLRGVVTLLLDGRSRQALQTTLALVEVLAGYVHGHTARQQLARVRAAGAALDLATRLIAAINTAKSFKGASFQLVNDLCRQLSVDRIALGWVASGRYTEGRRVNRCIAVSDTENIDRRMAMVQKLEAAMDECLDQEQPVMYPLPPNLGEGEVLLSQAITHSHRELAASDARLKIVTIPLRAEGTVLGTLLIEATGTTPIDLGTVELLQAALDLLTPVLEIRRRDDRNLALRAYDSSLRAGSWLVGAKHTGWKLAGLALTTILLVSIFVRIPYRVSAPVEIQARNPRTVSIPFDGVIRELGAGIEAGAKVEQGQVLLRLDTTDLELSVLDARAQIIQAEKQADEALRKNELAQAQQQQAKADQSRARLKLLEYRITQASVLAPITGTIIAGDIKDRVGSSVKLGDAIFQVADLSDMVIVAKVDDRDISLIAGDTTGQISPKSDPSAEFDFVVERIVPLSQPEEGTNSFIVRGTMTQTAPWFRPGMEGLAKFNTPHRSLIGIVSRRIVDQLRLWLWW